MAQTASPPPPDPLAPKLSTDPRNLPRFQKFDKPEQIQIGPPPLVFSEPPSAAGDTGFDSSNNRKAKAKKAKVKPKPPTAAQALAGTPPPQTVSPYQKPSKDSAAGAFAAAPGSPPVELGPIRQKPKKRKAHVEPDDPYAPLGVHAGAFTLFPAIELIGGYDTNPAHVNCVCSPGAGLYTIAPELQVQSNWSRHELKADLRGSYSGYKPDETPTLSRPYFNGKVDGRVDVTKTTRIDISGRALVSADNPGSPNLQADLAKLPIFTTLGGSFGLGQRFNRFDFSLKGDVERTSYQHSSLTDGTTASNDDRNYNQYGVILRGGYELTPGVTPFVEFDADTRKHDLNSDLSGYQRDSKGMTGKVGTTFELSRLLTGEVALGYTRRNYEDPRLDPLKGLIGSASLIWTANALTTAKLTASSTVAESTIAGVSGVLSRDIGLQVDHSFRRWLIGTAKLGFGVDSYHGTDAGVALCDCVVTTPGGTFADRVDKRFYAGLGLTYKLNRSVQVKGEVRHDWMRSNISNNDFNATTFLLGVRIQQ